jgi:hypothetical protein
VVGLCCSHLPAQERFDLQVPGTQVRSRAELTARTLTIIDAEGQGFVYTRHRDLDSRDGTYVGFLNSQLRRAIRWPIAGRGAFHIGNLSPGGQITFRESRMQISRIGPAPVTALRPVTPRPGSLRPNSLRPNSLQPNSLQPGALPSRPAHVATADLATGDSIAAYIDAAGSLQFAIEERGRWRLVPAELQRQLVPGAALALLPDRNSRFPQVFTAGRDGTLNRVANGRDLVSLIDARLVPGGQLLVQDVAGRPTMFAVNSDGHLKYTRLGAPRSSSFVDATGQLVPGGHIAMLDQDRLLAVDHAGVFRGYQLAAGRWLRDDPTSAFGRSLSGFAPGASIAALRVPAVGGVASTQNLVTVDALGRLQLLYETAGTGRWQAAQVPQVVLPPGTPVAGSYLRNRIRVSATLADGGWYEWHAAHPGGPWSRTLISRGFGRFTPIHFARRGRPYGFAVDRRGVLVAASLDVASIWHPMLLAPGYDFAPVLTSRQVVANPPLRPAQVTFSNEHSRELWLLVTDLRLPSKPRRFRLGPMQTVSLEFERDAGAKLVETAVPAVCRDRSNQTRQGEDRRYQLVAEERRCFPHPAGESADGQSDDRCLHRSQIGTQSGWCSTTRHVAVEDRQHSARRLAGAIGTLQLLGSER